MEWLWPEGDADEGKVLVSGAEGVGEGEVGLFQKLSGTDHWTDAVLSAGATATTRGALTCRLLATDFFSFCGTFLGHDGLLPVRRAPVTDDAGRVRPNAVSRTW